MPSSRGTGSRIGSGPLSLRGFLERDGAGAGAAGGPVGEGAALAATLFFFASRFFLSHSGTGGGGSPSPKSAGLAGEAGTGEADSAKDAGEAAGDAPGVYPLFDVKPLRIFFPGSSLLQLHLRASLPFRLVLECRQAGDELPESLGSDHLLFALRHRPGHG